MFENFKRLFNDTKRSHKLVARDLELKNASTDDSQIYAFQELLKGCLPDAPETLINDEPLLVRWLQGSSNDLASAAKRLYESIEWRKVNEVDIILEGNYLELLKSAFPVHLGSTDNFGRSVVFIPLKKWKLDQIPQLITTGQCLKFIISLFETLLTGGSQESMQKNLLLQKNREFVVIMDVKEFPASNFLKRNITNHLSQFAKVLESNYPRRLYRCIVINSGSNWDVLLLKHVLRPAIPWRKLGTPSCIHFYQNPSSWIDILRSIIPSEQLPLEYRGWKQLQER